MDLKPVMESQLISAITRSEYWKIQKLINIMLKCDKMSFIVFALHNISTA